MPCSAQTLCFSLPSVVAPVSSKSEGHQSHCSSLRKLQISIPWLPPSHSSQSLPLLTSHLHLRMAQPILSSPESLSPAVWVWQGLLWKVYGEDHPLSKGHSLSSFPSYFGPPVIIHVSTWVIGILLLNIVYFTMNASSEICFIVFSEI